MTSQPPKAPYGGQRPFDCAHCGLGRSEHLNRTQCLFSPTEFMSNFEAWWLEEKAEDAAESRGS